MQVVYSQHSGIHLGDHPWHTSKYAGVLDRLKAEGVIAEADVVDAPMADDEDVMRVHTLDYWRKLCDLDFSEEEVERLEIPMTQGVVDFFWRAAGGTLLASELALKAGVGVHLGGGFHHAFADYGSGFCLINDIAVSLRALLDREAIGSAAVIDCDLHQGDGTARIFRDDPRVFTMSIHQRRAFPYCKQRSSLDIELEDGTGDERYLTSLQTALDQVFDGSRTFDLVHYQAGADPYAGDSLGRLKLSVEGLLARDRLVLGTARAAGTPVVVTLGGGYPVDVADVVTIHGNTVLAAAEAATDGRCLYPGLALARRRASKSNDDGRGCEDHRTT